MPAHDSAFSDIQPDLKARPLRFALPAAELASLLASRLCHDLISPVGAVNNAMELYEEGLGDKETMNLIKMSAHTASARLQFSRLAYGMAGGSGDAVSAQEAGRLARDYLGQDKAQIAEWNSDIFSMPKETAKLLLNLVLAAAGSIPRGGKISAHITAGESAEKPRFRLRAQGVVMRLPPDFAAIYQGNIEKEAITAHNIQFYWTILLSEQLSMPIQISLQETEITFLT